MKSFITLFCLTVSLTSGLRAQDACATLAKHGVFEYEKSVSEEESFRNTVKWLYESTISTQKELEDTGLSLGIPLGKIPLNFGFNSSGYSFSDFRREMQRYLSDQDYRLSTTSYESRKANVELARAITNCKGVSAFYIRGLSDEITLSLKFTPAKAGETGFSLRSVVINPSDVAEISSIPNCSDNGSSTGFPMLVDVGGCNIPITWRDKTKGFSIILNTNYAGHENTLTVRPVPPPVTPEQPEPSYRNTFIKIQTVTGRAEKNDTNEYIEAFIVGKSGQSVRQRLNNRGVDDFRRGATDTFILLDDKTDIGKIASVEFVIKDGSDSDNKINDWFIASFTITDVNRAIDYKGEVGEYIGDSPTAIGRSVKKLF